MCYYSTLFSDKRKCLLKLALYLASFGPGNVSALSRIGKHITLGPSDTEGFRSKQNPLEILEE